MSQNKDMGISLDFFRDVLAIFLLVIAVPIMISGYIGVMPENFGLTVFLGFIVLSIGYFVIDKLIKIYLIGNKFEAINNLYHGKLLERLDKD